MRQPEPDPGNPRKVTTVILTDYELWLVREALKFYADDYRGTSIGRRAEDAAKLLDSLPEIGPVQEETP